MVSRDLWSWKKRIHAKKYANKSLCSDSLLRSSMVWCDHVVTSPCEVIHRYRTHAVVTIEWSH